MQLNAIIFPRPSSSQSKFGTELLYVPSRLSSIQGNSNYQIPCLLLKYQKSDHYLLYFHGNAEDLSQLKGFLWHLSQEFKMNAMAMEYPGYGLYTDNSEPSQEQIERDAQTVYLYIVNTLKASEDKIVIFGRSIGGGPACYIASHKNPKALILMSAFQSLQKVAVEHVSFIAYLVKDRFDNKERAKTIKCPTLVIHGRKDTLIPCRQSEAIFQNLASKMKRKFYSPEMTHNDFDMREDLLKPVTEFFKEINQLAVQQTESTQQQLQQDPLALLRQKAMNISLNRPQQQTPKIAKQFQ